MRSFILFILAAGIIACGTDKEPLFEEVMEIHDAVMPKVSDMSKLGMQLKKQKADADSAAQELYTDAIVDLERAEEAMFAWMNDFDATRKGPENRAYLEAEKEKITQVSEMMLASIEKAKKLLAEHGKK